MNKTQLLTNQNQGLFFINKVIDREDDDEMNIYANVDDINSHEVCRGTEGAETTRNQPSQHTGSECVKNRSFRSVTVCLVVLCVLLLTAVIVLCVLIYTNNHQCHIKNKNITEERDQMLTNITEERDQLLTKYTNITEERDQLLTKNTDLIKERDQLLTKNTDLIKERDQLLTKNTVLIKERDQLLTKNTDLIKERDQLLTKNTVLIKERDQLLTKNTNLIKERDQLLTKNTVLIKERDQLLTIKKEKDRLLSSNIDLNRQIDQLTQQINELRKILNEADGWINYKLHLYHISSVEKSWTESRKYCRERGADLIIINNKEEQDFVKKYSGSNRIWIGLSDSEREGTWKWVDGSTLTSKFWASDEPNSKAGDEDCVASGTWWADWPCNVAFKYICEKHIFK